jgi:hypothetical protein
MGQIILTFFLLVATAFNLQARVYDGPDSPPLPLCQNKVIQMRQVDRGLGFEDVKDATVTLVCSGAHYKQINIQYYSDHALVNMDLNIEQITTDRCGYINYFASTPENSARHFSIHFTNLDVPGAFRSPVNFAASIKSRYNFDAALEMGMSLIG